jgi:TetR/AcrR family transcriptional regulator, cholesterol catabolism regulator
MRKGTKIARDAQLANRVEQVVRLARENPLWGQARVADALKHTGYFISASGVRKIWQRFGLETTYKRLKAIEGISEERALLTPAERERIRRGDRARSVAVRKPKLGKRLGEMPTPQIILQAAAEVFVEQGYTAASLRDIARRAGQLAGSVYHHFESKQALFLAVHREGFRQLMAAVRPTLDLPASPWLRLEEACRIHIQLMLEGGDISSVTAVSLFAIFEPALQRRLLHDRRQYEEIFRSLIKALPLSMAVDRSMFRLCLLGALNWSRTWYRGGRLTPARIAQSFVSMLKTGAPISRRIEQRSMG